MEVEIISKEYIKPFSPTPHHLRAHMFSMLDQFIPPCHIPIILYYPINNDTPNQTQNNLRILKHSLSQTLSRFYPLAGRIKNSLCIDCNDEGVFYVEARVKVNLSEFMARPDLSMIHHFLPKDTNMGAKVALVQVSVFDCDGITIGFYISHALFDGQGLSTFINAWGGNARGCCDSAVCPDFTSASTFCPQVESFPKELTLMAMLFPFLKKGKGVTRRFIFDASSISKLKAESRSQGVRNPTRVEVVSALIWKCTMTAFKVKCGIAKPSLLSHAVNLRKRLVAPLSEYVMGNLIGVGLAQCAADTDTELGNLVFMVREAIAKTNCEFLKSLNGDQGRTKFIEVLKELDGTFSSAVLSNKAGAEYIAVTSLCHLGFYEVDFEWGKPMWVSKTGSCDDKTSLFMNYVCLLENKCGDGVEAWVVLEEEDMAILESDTELFEFTSYNQKYLQDITIQK